MSIVPLKAQPRLAEDGPQSPVGAACESDIVRCTVQLSDPDDDVGALGPLVAVVVD